MGWVGRLSAEKGPDTLIEALRELGELPFLVSVVGDGSERPSIELRVRQLALENRVTFHGIVPQAAQYYRSFDALVLSSRTEGTPMGLFEPMDAGGVPDVVTTEEALLVLPEDPIALARAIRSVYQDPDGSAARASAVRRRLKTEFALEPWLEQYESIYRRVVGQRASARS